MTDHIGFAEVTGNGEYAFSQQVIFVDPSVWWGATGNAKLRVRFEVDAGDGTIIQSWPENAGSLGDLTAVDPAHPKRSGQFYGEMHRIVIEVRDFDVPFVLRVASRGIPGTRNLLYQG